MSAKTGKRMPVDAAHDPAGQFVMNDKGEAEYAPEGDTRPRYTSHFATCPDANDWRKGKK